MILRQFERRLQNDPATETKAALSEIFRIVALRLDQRVEAADRLPVHGRLSTHVLDTGGGHPAAGVTIELLELSAGGDRRVVTATTTNRDGRTDQPLIGGRPLPIGSYELRFHVGAYFAQRGIPQGDPPFLDVVPVHSPSPSRKATTIAAAGHPLELLNLSRQLNSLPHDCGIGKSGQIA